MIQEDPSTSRNSVKNINTHSFVLKTQLIKMEPQTKKMKMENEEVAPTNETKFMDLNDDCIDAVLQWLPIEDLHSMSFTCKRIYQLSDSVYRRQHFENVWVRLEENENFETSESLNWNKRYVLKTEFPIPKRFFSEIPNLYIKSSWSFEVFRFIKTDCCRNLKRLGFRSTYLHHMERKYCKIIKDQLSTVEWIRADLLSDENLHVVILQFCGNLTRLNLTLSSLSGKTSWSTQVYPKLASLELYVCIRDALLDSEAIGAFKNFIERNVQLELIECQVELIAAMLPTIPKIKRLKTFLYGSQISDMKRCCETGSIEWLDVRASSINIFDELADVKSLCGLHFSVLGEELEKLSALQRMTELRELGFNFNKSVCQIASMLPNLTRIQNENALYLWDAQTMNDFLMPFAKNSKKLKEIISGTWVNGLTFQNFMEMDLARSMLGDAEKLSIYLHALHGFIPNDFLRNENLAKLKFIQIKFRDWNHRNLEIFDFE